MTLAPDSLVANRFQINRVAGSGGMGTVYRALDRDTNRWVALKILGTRDDLQTPARFAREAAILAELSHPGIVAFVAHGQTQGGQDYIAMEWLEGEDLAARLRRGVLTVADSLVLLRRVAEALRGPHQGGIVHRDLKPSNLFLPNGQVDRVKVLDFGIARRDGREHAMTQTGMVVGTPWYMAPEQARGQREIGSAADIFSLGCVLHECLTGQPPFVGEHVVALLAKILFEEAPPLRRLHPELPVALETLVGKMLVKEAKDRIPHADALLAELIGLDSHAESLGEPRAVVSLPVLTKSEQRLVSVIVATPGLKAAALGTAEPTEAQQQWEQKESVRTLLISYGAQVELLSNGSLVATLTQDRGLATDQATIAAHCALLLRERWPDAIVALITGRGVDTQQVPLGQILDRAGRLLGFRPERAHFPPSGEILLDAVTAGLLKTRFRLRRTDSDVFMLDVSEITIDETQLLLGKPTPCVGREAELGALDSILAGCLDNAVARAALVVADAGTGKSRLRHEFLRRVTKLHPDLLVLSGFGDPMAAGSAYGLLRQILGSLCGIRNGEDENTSRDKLVQRVSAPIAPFLGELCGVPFPDDNNVRLKAARQDPLIMAQRIHEAFAEFVAAECARRPMLLVLEDLQWSDRLTVRLIDAVLRLQDRSLMVLALARPEAEDIFPKLWSGVVQVIPLRPLSKRPCERLVAEVLGKDAPKATVDRLIEQSGGNPFYLEELIRGVAAGQQGELPGTVMAMLSARLMRLEPGARRALRAASVFGEIFWRGGIRALLDAEGSNEAIQPWLDKLVLAELIEPRSQSRLAEETEYRFRHALTREAAYSMLVDADRSLGHRLAARFLEHAGERDPLVLAEHYERGEEPARAVPFYLRAAEQVFWGGDGDAAVTYAQRCLNLDARGPDRLACLSILLSVHAWRGDWPACPKYIEEILKHAPPGCPILGQPLLLRGMLEMIAGRTDDAVASMSRLLELPPIPNPLTLFGLMAATLHFDQISHFDLADKCVQRLTQIVGPLASSDPGCWLWLAFSHALHDKYLGQPYSGLIWAQHARTAASAAGNRRMAHTAQVFGGIHLGMLGKWAQAAQELKEALAIGPELGPIFGQAMAHLILTLAAQGALAAAQGMADQFIEAMHQREMRIEEGLGRWGLCEVLGRLGELAAAEAQARQACQLLAVVPSDQMLARSSLANILLRSGRSAEALALSGEVLAQYRALGGRGLKLTLARLNYAESLSAVGRTEEARAVLAEACTGLVAQANAIADPELRRSFLEEVPENARTLALHQEGAPSA